MLIRPTDIHIGEGVNLRPIAVKSAVAASLIGVTSQTLANWRVQGRGPRFVSVSPTRVLYKIEDLEAWLDDRRGGAK